MDITITDAPTRRTKAPTYNETDARAILAALAKVKKGQVVAFDKAQDGENKARGLARKMAKAIEATGDERSFRTSVIIGTDDKGATYRAALGVIPEG